MLASIAASLLGAPIGALLIAGVLYSAFSVIGLTVPRFFNLWKAAFLASVAFIIVDGVGSEVLPGDSGALLILVLGLIGAFLAYDRVLRTPDGEPMGRAAAAVALGTHAVFSLAMFLIALPFLMAALL